MKKVLVLGASGLLGLNLALQAQNEFDLLGVVHRHALKDAPFQIIQADLLEERKLHKIVAESGADMAVNCVALADLEACEKDPEKADLLNHKFAGSVARACNDFGIALAHISTDAVFDGQQGNYVEANAVNPLGVYARSKLAGEQAVSTEKPEAIIARVNFFGWSLMGKRSLAEFFYNNLKARQQIKGLADRFFNPLHASHLSSILLKMLTQGLSGIFHVGSPISLSKYEFGMAIARQFNFDEGLIEKSLSADLAYQAARSPKLTMNVGKLQAALDAKLPDVYAGIQTLFEQEQSGYRQTLQAMGDPAEAQIERNAAR